MNFVCQNYDTPLLKEELMCTKGTQYHFNNLLYCQIYGVSISGPLNLFLDNIFVGKREQRRLKPIDFETLFNSRYFDNPFTISIKLKHATYLLFLEQTINTRNSRSK